MLVFCLFVFHNVDLCASKVIFLNSFLFVYYLWSWPKFVYGSASLYIACAHSTLTVNLIQDLYSVWPSV